MDKDEMHIGGFRELVRRYNLIEEIIDKNQEQVFNQTKTPTVIPDKPAAPQKPAAEARPKQDNQPRKNGHEGQRKADGGNPRKPEGEPRKPENDGQRKPENNRKQRPANRPKPQEGKENNNEKPVQTPPQEQ